MRSERPFLRGQGEKRYLSSCCTSACWRVHRQGSAPSCMESNSGPESDFRVSFVPSSHPCPVCGRRAGWSYVRLYTTRWKSSRSRGTVLPDIARAPQLFHVIPGKRFFLLCNMLFAWGMCKKTVESSFWQPTLHLCVKLNKEKRQDLNNSVQPSLS